jgi:hypothetical protein
MYSLSSITEDDLSPFLLQKEFISTPKAARNVSMTLIFILVPFPIKKILLSGEIVGTGMHG